MDKKFIGLNAGIIWRIISDQQKWKYSELKQKRQSAGWHGKIR